jgi:hypothetical protein
MVDDKVADTTAKRVSASVNALGATVGGAYDIDAETSTVVGSFTAGSNTFRAGADLDADQNVGKKVFELDHAFSKSTNAYINVSKDGNNTDYTVAMRMVF